MLENLNTAKNIKNTPFGTPQVELHGNEGEATTPGLKDGQDFRDYLIDAGMDPDRMESLAYPVLAAGRFTMDLGVRPTGFTLGCWQSQP